MKITDKRTTKTFRMESLMIGDCFEYNNNLYMKIRPVQICEGSHYAIWFTEHPIVVTFDGDELCKLVDAELIIG